MNRDLLHGRLLFIYQMPKTGSQTVEATLQECQLPHQMFRFHFLSRQIARTMRKALRSQQATEAWKELARAQLRMITQIRRIIRWRKWLSGFGMKLPKLEIITAVREPIGLGLSSVFENHSFLFPNLGGATVQTCRTELLRPRALKYVQNWFDLEIKARLGIDVYTTLFPQARGYAIYENRFVRLLLYRTDVMEQLPKMLGEFLNCEVPTVVNRNIGRSKDYGAAYEDVKGQLRMPPGFVAAQCNSKMMRHFYSDAERRKLIERWAEVPAPNSALAA